MIDFCIFSLYLMTLINLLIDSSRLLFCFVFWCLIALANIVRMETFALPVSNLRGKAFSPSILSVLVLVFLGCP